MPSENEYLTPRVEKARMRQKAFGGDAQLEFATAEVLLPTFGTRRPVARTTGNGIVHLFGTFKLGSGFTGTVLLYLPSNMQPELPDQQYITIFRVGAGAGVVDRTPFRAVVDVVNGRGAISYGEAAPLVLNADYSFESSAMYYSR